MQIPISIPDEPTKIWNATFVSVFITNMLMYLGQWMCNALVAKYADHLGALATTVGVVTSSFALTALLFKFISAPAIDTFNRKYVLAGAMSVMGIAFVGYSFSRSIPLLMVFRLLQGVSMAFTATSCLALASDALPSSQLGTGIAYFSLAQAACQAIGPTLSLTLASAIGYNATFAVAACFTLIGAFTATRIRTRFKRTRKFRISMDSIVAKEALIPATIMFLLSITYSIINSFLVIYGGRQGVGTRIGYFFTVYALTLLFSRPMVGRLTDKFGHVKVLIPAMLCFATAFVMISFSAQLWMFLLAAFVSAFGYGACQPAVQALAMKMVPRDRRGAGSCTSFIGNDAGNLVGPPLAGAIVEQFGYASMWRVMIFPVFLAISFVLVFRYRIGRAGEGLSIKKAEILGDQNA
jgi:MFS family permease